MCMNDNELGQIWGITIGGGSFSITSTFALSTSIPLPKILCPRTMPFVTMKLHFSQFSTKFVSTHRFRTVPKLLKQDSNDSLNTKKSSMNTSMHFSIGYENIACIHLWNVVGALHRLKGMRLYAKCDTVNWIRCFCFEKQCCG